MCVRATSQMAGASAVLVVNDEPGADLSTAISPEEEVEGASSSNL